jgi:hypothetical protein
MKKAFEEAALEIVRFDSMDVITTSCEGDCAAGEFTDCEDD